MISLLAAIHVPEIVEVLMWEQRVVVAYALLLQFERPAWTSEDQVPANTNKSVQVPCSTLVLSWRLLYGTEEPA